MQFAGKFSTAGELHELFRPAAFSAQTRFGLVRSFPFFRFVASREFSKAMHDPGFGLREKIPRATGTGQSKLGQ